MNFYITFPGQMCNQLILLHYIYNSFESVEKIYAPRFDKYKSYFKIDDRDILCDYKYFMDHKESFQHVEWGTQKDITIPGLYHTKFDGFKLKDQYEAKVKGILDLFGGLPLISVHIRQGDFIDFSGGRHLFSVDRYREVTTQKIKDWNLPFFQTLFFSDIILPSFPEGKVVSQLTDNVGPIDLFIMAQCSYFVHTWSTFSLVAIQLSKSLGKFKNNHIMDIG